MSLERFSTSYFKEGVKKMNCCIQLWLLHKEGCLKKIMHFWCYESRFLCNTLFSVHVNDITFSSRKWPTDNLYVKSSLKAFFHLLGSLVSYYCCSSCLFQDMPMTNAVFTLFCTECTCYKKFKWRQGICKARQPFRDIFIREPFSAAESKSSFFSCSFCP